MPAPTRIAIPARGVDCDPTVPEPQAKGVDKNQEADVGGNGIAKLARAAARRCPRTLYEPAKPSTSTT